MSDLANMRKDRKSNSGFSLLEMMISTVILLGVSGVVMSGLLQTTHTEGTVQNRTEMHAAVRSATELMQQEIGQAGRIALPAAVTLAAAVAAGPSVSATLSSTAGMFANEYLVVDAGSNQETVQIISIGSGSITAAFRLAHASGVPVSVQGGFGTGVVPESASPYNMTNGSDGTHLKLYGDINDDGKMVYVEYICDWQTSGNLYRSVSAFDTTTIAAKQVLLPNLYNGGNPGGTPCFVYQEEPSGCAATSATNPCFVTDVAVTLTVQTQLPDPSTGAYQKETKALLNVSPRNVFDAYQLSTLSNNRVEPMPSTVTALLSQTP